MPAGQLWLTSRASANRAPHTDGSTGRVLAALCHVCSCLSLFIWSSCLLCSFQPLPKLFFSLSKLDLFCFVLFARTLTETFLESRENQRESQHSNFFLYTNLCENNIDFLYINFSRTFSCFVDTNVTSMLVYSWHKLFMEYARICLLLCLKDYSPGIINGIAPHTRQNILN